MFNYFHDVVTSSLQVQSAYYFTVSVRPHGDPWYRGPRSSTWVTVYVSDVNDNPPRFIYPPPTEDDHPTQTNHTLAHHRRTKNITVSDLSPYGFVVALASAGDLDASSDERFIFSIISTNTTIDGSDDDPGRFFTIDSKTGAISVSGDLRKLRLDHVLLRLKVSDSGDPPMFAYSSLPVTITRDADLDEDLITRVNRFF